MRSVSRRVLVSILVGAVVAACGMLSPSDEPPPCEPNAPVACTVIDGFPVGRLTVGCGADGAACGDVALLALLALDAREPDHPPPTLVQRFEPDMSRVCDTRLCVFSSQQSIVVFTFADGSHRATGYQCQGVSPCVGTLTWLGWSNAIQNPNR
jgi:hypothetical protein